MFRTVNPVFLTFLIVSEGSRLKNRIIDKNIWPKPKTSPRPRALPKISFHFIVKGV